MPVADVRRFEQELLTTFRAKHADLLEHIRSKGTMPDAETVDAALRSFLDGFAPSN